MRKIRSRKFSWLKSSGLPVMALLLCLGFPRAGAAFPAAGKFSVDPFRPPMLASSGEGTEPLLLAQAGVETSPTNETAGKNPAPKLGKQRYFSNEGMALTLFGAVLWQQTLATKEMLLVWPTAVFGTIAVLLGPFSIGNALFVGETPRDSSESKEKPQYSITYVPYLVSMSKHSTMTGTVKAGGLGTGQFLEIGTKWTAHRLEYQIVPIADNGWIDMWYIFFKAEPIDFKLNLFNIFKMTAGFSTFSALTRWTDYQSKTSFVSGGGKYSGSQRVMTGYGAEGSAVLTIPLYITNLLISGEGAYYPWLSYPGMTGISAQFINLIGYNDLRDAGKYYWYRYRGQVELPINWILSHLQGRKKLVASKLLAGAEFATLKAEKKGAGVNNRGLSFTYNVDF